VNGASVGAPAGTLTAGSDSTLMVYGNAASSTATLITDDNHLPSAASNDKLRLVNGLTGAAVPLTMDVNFGNVASNILPGTASAYSVLGQSAVTQISVTSPNSLVPIFPVPPTRRSRFRRRGLQSVHARRRRHADRRAAQGPLTR
jgi:hypothetical protein